MYSIETLNKFLKDELSATETYQQVLDRLKDDAKLDESIKLMPIYEDHKEAVSNLQSLIHRLGGTPIDSSGIWGTWAKMVLGGANIFGKKSALKALQEGEKSGAKDFEEALEDKELPSDIRVLIETKLLPEQQEHVRILEQLLEATA
jgi:uncharacterized protein (TIGR02284 family)